MKKSLIKKGVAFLAGLALCTSPIVGTLSKTVASAGRSEQKIVTEDMYDSELFNQKWYKTRDIEHETGKIIFRKDKTSEESKIVSVILANDLREMNIETCISGRLSVKVNEALDGEFYIGFGLSRPYSEVNTASAICLFDADGAIGVKVENFDGDDMGVVYTAPTSYAYGEELSIEFDVFSAGSFSLCVNGESLVNHDTEKKVFSEGYFGFGQSAGSSVEIYDAEVRAATYDRPTNSNINETFSDGFNSALLYSEGGNSGYYTPEKVVCEDGVLKFTNVTVTGYISTTKEFSNFTMSYDIPHIQRVAERDEEGTIITPATNWIGVSIGCPAIKTNSSVAVAKSLFFYMMPVYVNGDAISFACVLLNNYSILKQTSISNEYNFFATKNGVDGEGNERTVNLKVEMLDGKLQVLVKYDNEPNNRYYKVMDYDLGYTPQGFVQIWGYGDDFNYVQNNMDNGRESYCANYWIDNLIIENKDENPNLVEAGFTSSKFPQQDDFLYVDEWDNRAETLFATDAPKEKGGCGSSIGIGSCMMLALAGGAFIMNKKGGKEE